MRTEVFNLATGETYVFYGLSPREAAIAGHAYSRRDYNTWNYEERYGHKVVVGESTIGCGDCVVRIVKHIEV